MREQLKKALKLARKTKDAIIFFDAETPEDSFAILDLDRYEEIVAPGTLNNKEAVYKADLTNEDLADKINREISDWKNQGQSDYLLEESKDKPRWQIPSDIKNKAINKQAEGEELTV